MKAYYGFIFVVFGLFAITNAELTCQHKNVDVPSEWVYMNNTCLDKMRSQIRMEIGAAMKYLTMAAHFSKDSINKLGFAKLFFEASSEERGHAIKLIEYLLMRGELTKDVNTLLKDATKVTDLKDWNGSGIAALKDALRLEAKVTTSIRGVIQSCEDDPQFNDYHLSDYLTGEFLEEQYKGQRDLAGKISVLDKLIGKNNVNANLGEFLFDKKLLSGEV